MLHQLIIRNYAIISSIEISFSDKLNVITGETGAGKSILMGALSLILGERADTTVLLNKEQKCFIEGVFKTRNQKVKDYLQENDPDNFSAKGDAEIIIRREISPNGKSRAFINDSPVNLNQLKEFSSLMVDLHQQFDTLELGDSGFQREVIDALADNSPELNRYQVQYKRYIAATKELEEWKAQQQSFDKELDYHKFLFDELEQADLKEDELENLELELRMMSNAENIKGTLSKVYFELQENEQPLVHQLKSLSNQLHTIEDFHNKIPELIERLHASQLEVQDIADEISQLNDAVGFDADRVEQVNERLATDYRLLKKHNVQTTGQLIEIKKDLQLKLDKVLNLDENIAKKEKEVKEFYDDACKIAETISGRRQKQVRSFEEKVNKLLAKVGMPNAKIKVEIKKAYLNFFGFDDISFLFDANKTGFESLKKVASGGELSRLMLCIKSLVAKTVQLPTLIFDEIDTGISGEAARQVGIIMKELSNAHQVISITHQPQIAAKATVHYFVYKEIKDDKIITSVKLLDKDERITAIATMLSGEKPTAAAFENAREMISN